MFLKNFYLLCLLVSLLLSAWKALGFISWPWWAIWSPALLLLTHLTLAVFVGVLAVLIVWVNAIYKEFRNK